MAVLEIAAKSKLAAATNYCCCLHSLQVAVCKEQVEWAIAEKRTFLRQRIQLRLASLYLDTAEYQDSLKIVGTYVDTLSGHTLGSCWSGGWLLGTLHRQRLPALLYNIMCLLSSWWSRHVLDWLLMCLELLQPLTLQRL